MITNYHLSYHSEVKEWVLFKPGDSRCTAVYTGKSKEQAIQAAAQLLAGSGSSLRIHNLNGQFEEERTYPRSSDPPQSPG